jgi:hypothetical protein
MLERNGRRPVKSFGKIEVKLFTAIQLSVMHGFMKRQ